MQTRGLRLEDSPPIEIPFSFFATAPVAPLAAGLLLLCVGIEGLSNRWHPLTLALTHLGTLGFVSMVMLGALYQMISVIVGNPVPMRRLAHGVHALFSLGTLLLCWGLAASSPSVMTGASVALGVALLLFLAPVAFALIRTHSLTATLFGMRMSIACLSITAFLGILMALGLAGLAAPGPRPIWTGAHLSVALLGWVGGLIAAVSWQVLPMFYLARSPAAPLQWCVQGLAGVGALLPVVMLGLADERGLGPFGLSLQFWLGLAAAPGVGAIWILHPISSLWSLAGRRRKRRDASLLFWQLGLCVAPLSAVVGIAAWSSSAAHWDLLFGWLVLWGWVGSIMHGMLARIVPFLVWLHYFAPLVGKLRVPSVRKLLPDEQVHWSFRLHVLTLALGCTAILSQSDAFARLTGAALILDAISLGGGILYVLAQRPRKAM